MLFYQTQTFSQNTILSQGYTETMIKWDHLVIVSKHNKNDVYRPPINKHYFFTSHNLSSLSSSLTIDDTWAIQP